MADAGDKAAQLRARVGPAPSDIQLYKLLDRHKGDVDAAAAAYAAKHGAPARAPAAGAAHASGAPQGRDPNLLRVHVPAGKKGGDTMQARAPDGRMLAVRIPEGLQEFDSFECQMPPPARPPAAHNAPQYGQAAPMGQPVYAGQPVHGAQPVYGGQPGYVPQPAYYQNGQPVYTNMGPVTAPPPAPAPAQTIVIQPQAPQPYYYDRGGDGAFWGIMGGIVIADAILD